MKKLLITLAIILFPAMAMAESVWVHDSQGNSRMLDVSISSSGQVRIWDMSNGGFVSGNRSGDSNYFLDYQTGKGTWIDGDVDLGTATQLYLLDDD